MLDLMYISYVYTNRKGIVYSCILYAKCRNIVCVYIPIHHVYAGCMYDVCGLIHYYMCITSFINTLQRNFFEWVVTTI